MKKIIILFLAIFTLTGCYDNVELNNLAIISGIGIDYENDEFIVTYEILNDTKTEEDSTMLSYIVKGTGKSISESFTDANYKIGKKAYFAHLQIVLLGHNLIENNFADIIDYLIRDIKINDEFYLIGTNDKPSNILRHNSKNNPVVSDVINNLIENGKYNNNISTNETFKDTLNKLVSKKQDIILNTVSIIDNEIGFSDSILFHNYFYHNTLDKNNTTLYNLLTKTSINTNLEKEYSDGLVVISINNSKTDLNITSDKITINLKAEGKVALNNPSLNLKDAKTYEMLNKDFANILEEDIANLIRILQKNKSDILGLQNIYYKNTRQDNHDLWVHANIEVTIDLKINTKGFIFEVENEKQD